MTASGTFALARRNLARNRRGVILSGLGVAISVGCLAFFTGLGAGITSVVRTKLFPTDARAIEVVPPHVSFGGLFGAAMLDSNSLQRFRSIPGVEDVLPKMSLRVSAASHYDGAFFGHPIHMGLEIMAVGVDPRLVSGDLDDASKFVDPKPGDPIPVVISTQLLELYNKSFAAQRGLPELTPQLLTGFRFPVELGVSYVSESQGTPESTTMQVVGFSPHALLGGVTIPLATAQRLNRQYRADADTYSSIVIRASSPDAIPAISDMVRRQGFDLDTTQEKLGEQIGFGVLIVTAALGLLSLLVTLLAAVNIAHAFHAAARERRREIGILRAVGASGRDVLRLFLLEATLIGAGGAGAGVLGGVAAGIACNIGAKRWLPDFPFKPDSFFQLSPVLLVAAFAVGVIAALLGAWGPARAAARSEPAAALAE